MTYRVSGKLNDGRSFSDRIDAADAAAAWEKSLKRLSDAKIKAADIAEYRVRPMGATKAVTIGKKK